MARWNPTKWLVQASVPDRADFGQRCTFALYEILDEPEYVKTQILNRMRNVEKFEELIAERVSKLESAKSE